VALVRRYGCPAKVHERIYLVTTIYLVQHGDKERSPGLKALYSSPLWRSRETAEPVRQATGVAMQSALRHHHP
jgi:hypothetical protein